jgi:hypothetical protein
VENKKTFCSKVICEALQYAGIEEVQGLVPSCTTPSRLYHVFMFSKKRICASVPYKRNMMIKKPIVNLQNYMYRPVSQHDIF